MTRSILLTSLDALSDDRALEYYAAENEYGNDYCEALQSMEASSKYILSRFPIDEIVVIGSDDFGNAGDGAGDGKRIRVKDARTISPEDMAQASTFDLYLSRIAQYIDEVSLEQEAIDELLPDEERSILIDFVRSFMDEHSKQEKKRLNRLFDELACDKKLYSQFKDELFGSHPDLRKDYQLTMGWVKNYLYTQLKASAKLEILRQNENVCVRYVPEHLLERRDTWFNSVFSIDQDVLEGRDEINLYVTLDSDSTVDPHLVMNILDILVSTPGSNVHVQKSFKVYQVSGSLTSLIMDSSAVFKSTDLVAAARAFLNYAKTDMLVDFWERTGGDDERVNQLVYGARHVDNGVSLCNIPEVQEGIDQLRELFSDKSSWTADGEFGLLFGIIAECVQADYSALLEGDGHVSFIELIKWAYSHQLYQQVLTLIESHAPMNMVRAGIFYYCDSEESKPHITTLLAKQRLELKPYELYKMDDIDHYFVKVYDRASARSGGSRDEDRSLTYANMRAESIDNQDPEKITGHTACDSKETVKNALYAYCHLGDVRNKISHADSDSMSEKRLMVDKNDVSYAMLVMREAIEYFIKCYEEAAAEAKGKDPNIVLITADEVRAAASRLKREQNQSNRSSNRHQ